MTTAPGALPPIAEVAPALRKTTEVLAYELAAPTSEPPRWTEFEWRIARAVAAMHGISMLLHNGLKWVPQESWQGFLRQQEFQSIARHTLISRLLDAIDFQSRRAGVALVALKGAALYAGKIYAPGERPMGDVDLLVRDADLETMGLVLDRCGYGPAFTTRRHQVFKPRVGGAPASAGLGEHVDNPIKVEVHARVVEHLPVAGVDITEFLFPANAHAGLNAYPSPAALMLHLLLHAAGNMRARALRLIQLHDIALLAARFGPDDWAELFAKRPGNCRLWWAIAPLSMVARYYPGAIPRNVYAREHLICPRWLSHVTRRHRLTDVSWSNIRIAAFPGVEWSRTPWEALKFMSGRIWPTRVARSELKEGAAQIPGASSIPWYGSAHSARVLRWIFSRPPRVQTMLSVRAALETASEEVPSSGN